jgi:hypothetical protein
MFRTDRLSIIRSVNIVFTATGICHTGYVDCLLARSLAVNITNMTNTCCCVYSVETLDDGQEICPKHVEFFTKINLRDSASRWLPLFEYITIHGPLNVKRVGVCSFLLSYSARVHSFSKNLGNTSKL